MTDITYSSAATNLKCTPRLRCFPAHSRQIQMPYVTLTHCGLSVPQSKQLYTPHSL